MALPRLCRSPSLGGALVPALALILALALTVFVILLNLAGGSESQGFSVVRLPQCWKRRFWLVFQVLDCSPWPFVNHKIISRYPPDLASSIVKSKLKNLPIDIEAIKASLTLNSSKGFQRSLSCGKLN